MGRKSTKDLDKKKVFLERYGDPFNYHLDISKICASLNMTRDDFEYWYDHDKEFVKKLEKAKKVAVDHLLAHYVTLFQNGNMNAGEFILKMLDPKRFGVNEKDKNSITDLVREVTDALSRRR